MDVDFTCADEELFEFNIFEFLVEDEVGAEFGDVELEILFGEDCGFALIIDDGHQLGIDFALLAEEEGYKYKEGVHDDAKRLVVMQVLYVSLNHALERRFPILRSQQGEVEFLNTLEPTWQQWTHLQQKILARHPESINKYRSVCAAALLSTTIFSTTFSTIALLLLTN